MHKKNIDVAAMLYELADLKEMKGIDWEPIQFRKAARTIEALPEDIEALYKKGGKDALMELPGVGQGIAGRIEEYLTTGRLKELEKLKASIPKGVEQMMHVMGLGPKKAMRLYKERKIKSVAELEAAAKSGRVRSLAGFGEKSEQGILKGIALVQRGEKRKTLGVALPLARELERRLLAVKGVTKAVAAGSLRRMKETVGDVDILAIAKNSKAVMDAFTKMPDVSQILAKGPTRSAVLLSWGPHTVQADVRVLEERSFGAALQYFTGSKEHNIRLRQLAIHKGWKLNEYGIFDKNDRFITGRTEEDVYSKLGLPYIEPELRENLGEIEAGLKRKLPALISYGSLKGDFHTHTNWSDGVSTTDEMVREAARLGYQYIAITDHSPAERIAHGLDVKRLEKHLAEIDKLQKRYPRIRILKGSEVSILPDGRLDYPDSALKKLDVVVASVHSGFKSSRQAMTKRVLAALDNRFTTILGHPTGRLINQREPFDVDLAKVYAKAAERGVWLEINSFPSRLDLQDVNVKAARERGCKFVIDTDSHSKDHLPFTEYGIGQARRGWCGAKDVINTLPWKKVGKLLRR
jgi:DNA polymerase (family 10)